MDVKAAAIYTRISADRAGEALGVARQEKLCRDLADVKGWPVADVYVDNDRSAYSGAPRPAYEAMLAAVADGTVDAVLVADVDRLTRTPAELETFIDVADAHGIALANVAGDLDLATSDGRFRARIMGAVARQESEKKSERLKRERAQAAERGVAHGGPRPFGFAEDRVTHRADEAAVIVEAARRIIAGESLRSVADDLERRGVVASQTGRGMTTRTLRHVLTNPRIAGMRRHRPTDRHGHRTGEEVVYPAAWEPIIDRETFEALQGRFGNGASKRGRPAVHLLTGVARCGRCGERMYAGVRTVAGRPSWRYLCRSDPGKAGCGKTAVTAGPLEEEVVAQLLAALSGGGLAGFLADDDDGDDGLGDELAGVESRLDDLASMFADGDIDRREWQTARSRLVDRAEALRRSIANRSGRGVLAALPDDEVALAAAWEAGSVGWRRAVLTATVDAVVVHPVTRRAGPKFDPDRVEVVWGA